MQNVRYAVIGSKCGLATHGVLAEYALATARRGLTLLAIEQF